MVSQRNDLILDEADQIIDMGLSLRLLLCWMWCLQEIWNPITNKKRRAVRKNDLQNYIYVSWCRAASLDWKYLKNPFVVITDTAGKTTDLILQHVIMMKESEKVLQIAETSLLDELGVKTAIVYIN